MMTGIRVIIGALCCGMVVTVATACNIIAGYGDVRLKGPLGGKLEKMVRNHVVATDVGYLTMPFLDKAERNFRWQAEFWGKWMHSAVPYWSYTGNAVLKQNVDLGVERVLSSQEHCGYVGNYPEELRCGRGWDVWGMKYTMLGLLHYYDGTGDRRALNACCRLCDYIAGELGPNGRRGRKVWQTGEFAGLASSSILEPVVWLYRRTDDKKYLDFAAFLVEGMSNAEEGPRLVDLALKGVGVADRNDYGCDTVAQTGRGNGCNRRKAYEMMSCYQGLLEYFEVTGKEDLLRAAIASAEDIMREEINLAGGATSGEHWFHGARKQHQAYLHPQETCVTVTWMRLTEKLLTVTGDSKWADELERSFYNAYLAALDQDCDAFAAYTPLNGSRSLGHDHCFLHANCCNANGPRGFLSFLRALLQANGDKAIMNLYASGRSAVRLPSSGMKVVFETYTYYPRTGGVRIENRTRDSGAFTLSLRIPAWSGRTTVSVNGKPINGPVDSGRYFDIARVWEPGDVVDVEFDLSVRTHECGGFAAFTRGPILLARDTRFADGPIDEVIPVANWDGLNFGVVATVPRPQMTLVRSPSDDIWMTFSVPMRMGSHQENPLARAPVDVHFCDYASAGNRWTPSNSYRTWIQLERAPDE